MTKDEKTAIIKEYGQSENDVGSAPVQIALLTVHVKELTEHLKQHRRDHASRRGLIAMVNRRRKLLRYLRRESNSRYLEVTKSLGLRS
jgi:small subunit ribosomal protein S15